MALFFKIGMITDKIGIEFFSLIRVVEGMMVANRDHKDFMPLVMGHNCKGGTFVSLSRSFYTMDAFYDRHVIPGEVFMMSKDGLKSHRLLPEQEPKLSLKYCVYEYMMRSYWLHI